ncbi:MAG: gliding motility-associated C-terminal domain-containing protein, partial [Saprospiraceae bacterium]|nr:gliding motility-associated C-terminal domain-containing protein [Saprospiraceae bacterium]
LEATDIAASQEVIANLDNAYVRQMHIGPDGSLYFLEENFPNPQIEVSVVYCPDGPNPEVKRNLLSFVASTGTTRFSAMNNLADFWFDGLLYTLEKDTTEQLLCPGIPLTIEPECSGETYAWTTGATTRQIAAETPGTYRVSVTNGCFTLVETIIVSPGKAPSVQIEHAPVSEICDVLPLTLNALSDNAETFRWSTGDTLAAISITGGGTYRVTVTNSCGEATTQVTWPETPCCRVYSPNAFSPNLDGVNDVFKLEPFRCPFVNFRLRVFSRWGELLFETNDPAIGWNGHLKGKVLPQGHYIWLATYQLATDAPDRVRQEKGGIHLLR